MFQQKKNAPNVGGHSASSIAEWKDEVQRFFSGEWENLRDLIGRLEEHDWDRTELKAPVLPLNAPRAVAQVPPATTVAQLVPATPEQTRLANLAEQLELRLREKSEHA